MPVYEYECEGCGKRFEKRMSFAEAETEKNPNCPQCQDNQHVHKRIVLVTLSGADIYRGYSNAGSCGSSGGFS